jgi:hypothetical protein
MTSNSPAEPTGKSLDPAQTSAGQARQPDQKGQQKPAPDDLPNADAAEPEPHEHLPSRSDDN